MSLLIYADGAIIQFEWLAQGKAELSWTNSNDRHFIALVDKTTGFEWRTGIIPGSTTSFIIDDEYADDLPKYYKAPGDFQGWSEYAGNTFEITLISRDDGSAKMYEIGQPYLGVPTHRTVSFRTIFPFYSIDPTAISSYKNSVGNALNISSEGVSLASYTSLGDGRLEVTTFASVLIELADKVEANGGWESRDPWRTICGGGNFTT